MEVSNSLQSNRLFWVRSKRLNWHWPLQHYIRSWWKCSQAYLEGEGVDNLAQLMRLGIEGGGPVEEATAAEHHPARLQLLISTVHKTPAHPNRTGRTLLSLPLFFKFKAASVYTEPHWDLSVWQNKKTKATKHTNVYLMKTTLFFSFLSIGPKNVNLV